MSGSGSAPVSIRIGYEDVVAAKAALESLGPAGKASLDRIGAAGAGAASGGLANLRNQVQALSPDFQFFATRVQSGTSALAAFGEFIANFGPWGAAAGAALALIATRFGEAGSGADDLKRRGEDAFKALTSSGEKAAETIRTIDALFRTSAENAAIAANAQIGQLRSQALRQREVALLFQESSSSDVQRTRGEIATIQAQQARIASQFPEGSAARNVAMSADNERLRQLRSDLALQEAAMARQTQRMTEAQEALDRLANAPVINPDVYNMPPAPDDPDKPRTPRVAAGDRDDDPRTGTDPVSRSLQEVLRGVKEEADANEKAQKEIERLREQTLERWERRHERTVDSIVDFTAERFGELWSDTEGGWDRMWENMQKTALAMVGRIAAELVLRPIVAPIVGALMGSPGGAAGGAGGAAGGLGGGTGELGTLGGIAAGAQQYGSSLQGVGNALFSSFPSPTSGYAAGGISGINSWAQTGYGFNTGWGGVDSLLNARLWGGGAADVTNAALGSMGVGADGRPFFGPASPAQMAGAGYGVSVGQLGVGALSIAGGAYGAYTGFQEGGWRGNTQGVAGTVGAIGGAAGIASAAGVGAGTALGVGIAATAAWAPYIAAALAAVALLMPEKEVNAGAAAGLGINDQGQIYTDRIGGKHVDQNEFGRIVQEQTDAVNKLLSDSELRLRPSGGEIFEWVGTGQAANMLPKTVADAVEFNREQLYSDNPNVEKVLRSNRDMTFEEVVGASNWIRDVYEPLGGTTDTTAANDNTARARALEEAVAAVVKQFDEAAASARELGLSEEGLMRRRAEAEADLRAMWDREQRGLDVSLNARVLRAQGDDQGAALLEFGLAAEDQRRALRQQLDALKLGDSGGYMGLLDQALTLEGRNIVSGDAAGGNRLQSYVTSLRTSDLSPLSPQAQRAATLEDLNRASKSGTSEEVITASDSLLRASRSLYGSGADFVADFGRVLDAVESAMKRETQTLTAEVFERVSGINAKMLRDVNMEMLGELRSLRRELALGTFRPAGLAA